MKLFFLLLFVPFLVRGADPFVEFASRIPVESVATLAVQHNGRIKPFDTFTREVSTFLMGTRHPLGLNPVQFYLALITHPENNSLQIIEVRNKTLREELGFQKSKRYFSIEDLEKSTLESKAHPLMQKEQENHRSLSADEKDTLEANNQLSLLKYIISGDHFLGAIDFSGLVNPANAPHPHQNNVIDYGKKYLNSLAVDPATSRASAQELQIAVLEQPVPELFAGYRSKLDLEVTYNRLRPFLIAGALYFCLALLLLFGFLKNRKLPHLLLAYCVPLAFHIAGFATRIYITGFAPVTNMYTTMLWVAFGVALFSIILLTLYKNQKLVGLLLLGCSLVLLLTESFPLILSPDMDPIVAVLRSNYWLTIHVLTITISYAAFTICMLIGNYALLMTLIKPVSEEFYKIHAHYVYRMAQLGVCLITAGIILGGIWADYSWGRFWGWDPKETWALIADMGFIVILHARYIGWLRSFGILATAPIAYLLVIMAWYGVNFILAAGLHSYGFSSGGALFVSIFVSLQLVLLAGALLVKQRRPLKKKSA